MEAGRQEFHGGDVCAGEPGLASVQLSGVAGRSKRSHRASPFERRNGSDACARRGWAESSASHIYQIFGSQGWWMDFSAVMGAAHSVELSAKDVYHRGHGGTQGKPVNAFD